MNPLDRHLPRSCAPVLTVAMLLAICCASGCAAIKATRQPTKKNLSVLTPGTPRTHVIAELGRPLYCEVRDGAPVDLFVFKQGYSKANKATRAFVHGAADVATGGLWEVVGIPAEAIADGTVVKVEVTYDKRRAVEKIEVIEGEDVVNPRPWFGRQAKPEPLDPIDAPVADAPNVGTPAAVDAPAASDSPDDLPATVSRAANDESAAAATAPTK